MPRAAPGGVAEIDALTGVRCIAALSIALAHMGHSVSIGSFIFGNFAIIGMPVFFTLSGFVIHLVYARPLARGEGTLEFGIARFARLWPLFFAVYIYFAIHTSFGKIGANPAHWSTIISYLTLTFSWFPFIVEGKAPIQHEFGISWSVSTEVFFYVCYALGLYRIGSIRRVSTCLIALVVFCLATIALMWALYVTRDSWEAFARAQGVAMPMRNEDWLNSFYRWFMYVSPYMRIFEFIGGCLTCQLYFLVRERPDLLRRLPAGWIASAGAAITIGLFILFCWYSPIDGGRWLASSVPALGQFFMTLHLNFLLAPGCYILYFGLAIGSSMVGKVMSTRVLVYLGIISYSIYLIHPLFAGRVMPDTQNKGLALLIAVGVLVAWSTATYLLIERPGRKYFRVGLRWLLRRRRPVAAAGSAD